MKCSYQMAKMNPDKKVPIMFWESLKLLFFGSKYTYSIKQTVDTKAPKPEIFSDKLNAIDQLFYRAQNYESSDEYMQTLNFIKKLRNLAPFNAWLLYQQNPDVTYTATANDWVKEFNRVIKPKARAYVIMRAFGPVDFVYDVLDTIGDKLPPDIQAPFRADGIVPQSALDAILKCCMKKSINISYDFTLGVRSAGWTSHNKLNETQQITINAAHSPEIQFSTLVHELAHLMLGHCGIFMHCECENRTHLTDETMEVEAETVSWLICNRLDIKTNADSYLSNHIKKRDALKNISLQKILTTSDRIENIIISGLCKKDKKKK